MDSFKSDPPPSKRAFPVCLRGSTEVDFYMVLETLPPIGSHLLNMEGDTYKVLNYTFIGKTYASGDELMSNLREPAAMPVLLVEYLGNVEQKSG